MLTFRNTISRSRSLGVGFDTEEAIGTNHISRVSRWQEQVWIIRGDGAGNKEGDDVEGWIVLYVTW